MAIGNCPEIHEIFRFSNSSCVHSRLRRGSGDDPGAADYTFVESGTFLVSLQDFHVRMNP